MSEFVVDRFGSTFIGNFDLFRRLKDTADRIKKFRESGDDSTLDFVRSESSGDEHESLSASFIKEAMKKYANRILDDALKMVSEDIEPLKKRSLEEVRCEVGL